MTIKEISFRSPIETQLTSPQYLEERPPSISDGLVKVLLQKLVPRPQELNICDYHIKPGKLLKPAVRQSDSPLLEI